MYNKIVPYKAVELPIRVYEARVGSGLSRKKLGKLVGVTEKTIYNIEKIEEFDKRKKPVSIALLMKIAEVTGYRLDWILHGEGEKRVPLVAVGTEEYYTYGAGDDEISDDLQFDYFQDRELFERWLIEEDALFLYKLTRKEVEDLSKLPVHDLDLVEEDYNRFYRVYLVTIRKGDHVARKKLRKEKEKQEVELKKAAGGDS